MKTSVRDYGCKLQVAGYRLSEAKPGEIPMKSGLQIVAILKPETCNLQLVTCN
ncbi:MAG: hypothetical protein NT175_10445 [Bacteroidetes bacterium]|nr:hypothetical protein [Bacteroidota bacterium]